MWKFFDSEKSTVRVGGPRQSPTGALPIVPSVNPFMVYRLVLPQLMSPFLLKLVFLQGCAGRGLGRALPPPPIPEGSFTFERPPITGVMDDPLVRLIIDPVSHEPKTSRSTLS